MEGNGKVIESEERGTGVDGMRRRKERRLKGWGGKRGGEGERGEGRQ